LFGPLYKYGLCIKSLWGLPDILYIGFVRLSIGLFDTFGISYKSLGSRPASF
jgi:hypothetical protein